MIERHDYYAYLLISSLLEAARAAIGKARNSERLRREEPGRRSYFVPSPDCEMDQTFPPDSDWQLTLSLPYPPLPPYLGRREFPISLYNSPLFITGRGKTGIDSPEKALNKINGFFAAQFDKIGHVTYLISLKNREMIGTVTLMRGDDTVPDIGFALSQYTLGMDTRGKRD